MAATKQKPTETAPREMASGEAPAGSRRGRHGIWIQADPDDVKFWQAAAGKAGVDLSTWIRLRLNRAGRMEAGGR